MDTRLVTIFVWNSFALNASNVDLCILKRLQKDEQHEQSDVLGMSMPWSRDKLAHKSHFWLYGASGLE